MDGSRAWRSGWVAGTRAAVAGPHGPAVAGTALAALALGETVVRLAGAGASTQEELALGLLALATTLPLAFLPPAGAATAVCGACALSLAAFRVLTVAGLCAQLIALYRHGRHGSPRDADGLLAVALALPFVALALAGPRPTASEAAVLTLLAAALGPAAALAGIAQRARRAARASSAARQTIASTLVEHTARGERARIARELHDVVAHHISMIAVRAETARLTTAGMPAEGAQRLGAIGDSARGADRHAPAARRAARGRGG